MSRLVESAVTTMGAALHRAIQGMEGRRDLARAASGLLERVRPVFERGRRGEIFHGSWLGHAAHPFMTDFPEGAWMAASFLDLFGPEGSEPHSQRLLAFGLVSALPAWLSGLAEWSSTEGPERQSGLVHAVTSSLATVLYGASYAARRRDRHSAGVVIGLAGGVTAMLDGWIGGHLSLSRGVGVAKNAFDRPPADWTPCTLESGKLVEGRPNKGFAGSFEIAVVRAAESYWALGGRCSFCGASLGAGTLWEKTIMCGKCRSCFRAEDGKVANGPASVPQASLEIREAEASIEVRAGRSVDASFEAGDLKD